MNLQTGPGPRPAVRHPLGSVPSPQLYNWLAQGDQVRRLQMLKAQPVWTPLLVDCEEGVWPHTTTNDNGESIHHYLPCPFS